jgi:hypothetical protein
VVNLPGRLKAEPYTCPQLQIMRCIIPPPPDEYSIG